MILIKASKGDEENPNVRTLSAQLRQMLSEKGDDSRAMVFVQARATCKALAEVLDLEFKDVRINVHYLFGQDTRGSITGTLFVCGIHVCEHLNQLIKACDVNLAIISEIICTLIVLFNDMQCTF